MSSPSHEILAIIPVYQKYEQRDRCLAALAKLTVAVDTFIHDNTTDNIGYTKACNRGLREALKRNCRFALLLNQDCYPEPDAIEKLVTLMHEQPRCALAGPMQVRAEAPDEIINAGGLRAFPFGVHRAGKRSAGMHARSEQVAWVNGACMFARIDAVIEFGLMDESMFLIGSDSDWSLTARLRGWECWHCADSIVLHEGGVSHATPSQDIMSIFHRDMSYWRRKWVGTVLHRQLDRPIGEPRIAGPIDSVIQKASQDHAAGRLVDAEVAYRDVLEVDANNFDALNLLGVIELQHGMAMVAHDLFRRAIELAPQIAQFHSHLAAALAMMNRKDEAAKEFIEAVRLETKSPQMLESLAVELARMGRMNEAAEARAKAAGLRQMR